MATNCTSFPLITSSSKSISTSKPKQQQQLVPSSYPFISLTRRLSPPPPPPLIGTRTATTYFGFTARSNTFPSPRPSPAAAAASLSDAIPEQTTITDNNATSTIISVLLFIAFIGLSILTIGVIYIAVTDFLQKREGEKFQKEEAERKKKSGGKKRQMKARAGPKGFGQKIVEIDDEADVDDI